MKNICLLFLLLLIISSISPINAQTDEEIEVEEFLLTNATNNLNIIKEKQNEIIEKEIILPENIERLTKLIFGLKKEEKLDVQKFVILSCLLVVLILFLTQIVKEISDQDKLIAFFISLIIALIGSVSGGVNLVANLFIGFVDSIKLLAEWGIIKITLILAILIGTYVAFSILTKKSRDKDLLEKARRDGEKAGLEILKLKKIAETKEFGIGN